MKPNKIFIRMVSGVAVLCLTLGACACDKGDNISDQTEDTSDTEAVETEINYDGIVADDYVKSVTYSGMTVYIEELDAQKDKALWHAIYTSAQITSYPEDKVDYYFNQTKKAYMYIAGNYQGDYELLLKNRGIDEQDMREEARVRVLEDLVYKYILEKEGIVLTAEDKSENFDKYVEKLAMEIGKSESYVISEMTEYVYETMLHDKTTEYLISVNTFKVAEESSETTENK